MRKVKIFAMPSHTFIDRTSGVDFLRIIQPMTALNGYKDRDIEIETKVFNHKTDPSFDWRDIFQEYDAVYFNYTTNDVGYAVMGTLAQKYGKKLIMDVDDDLTSILPDNGAYEIFKPGSWGREVVTAIMGDVHHVTVTNKHLKNSVLHNTNRKSRDITVLPNYIDLDVYNHRCEFKDRGYYKAIHFGSSTHFASFYSKPFMAALDRIMREFPNFTFMTVGAFVAEFKKKWGMRYEQLYGDPDLFKWIEKQKGYMDDADFMLVPMTVNSYNKSKSSCKYLEASSYKIPGAWQNIRQYRELIHDGKNGFLCETEDEWYRSIKKLILDAKLRKSMGSEAFETIQEWQMKRNIEKYAEMIKIVLA